MSVSATCLVTCPGTKHVYAVLAAMLVVLIIWRPGLALQTGQFVVYGMLSVTPLVVPGILLAAWIAASGASGRVAAVFRGRTLQAVVGASMVGATIPVCGVTVLPLMAGLLAARVPLAPVMAFWLASPITGPAMLSATIATLGWPFAVGKALAAIGLGLFGGGITAAFARHEWVASPLRSNLNRRIAWQPEPRLWRRDTDIRCAHLASAGPSRSLFPRMLVCDTPDPARADTSVCGRIPPQCLARAECHGRLCRPRKRLCRAPRGHCWRAGLSGRICCASPDARIAGARDVARCCDGVSGSRRCRQCLGRNGNFPCPEAGALPALPRAGGGRFDGRWLGIRSTILSQSRQPASVGQREGTPSPVGTSGKMPGHGPRLRECASRK